MAFLFRSPTAPSPRPRENPLMRHVVQPPRGRHVLREAGVWKTVDTLTTQRERAAQVVLYGGHESIVSDAYAAELVLAGYSSSLTAEVGFDDADVGFDDAAVAFDAMWEAA